MKETASAIQLGVAADFFNGALAASFGEFRLACSWI
jgi:hypothetical protein